jgi:hypothetical protein
MHNSIDKNRGTHGDSSFMLDGLPSSRENSNAFRYGECHRRIQQPEQSITVADSYNKIYRESGCELSDYEREKIEKSAYKSAVKQLGFIDKSNITGLITGIERDRRLKNMGETSAYELLAKLGVWLGKIPKKEFDKLTTY